MDIQNKLEFSRTFRFQYKNDSTFNSLRIIIFENGRQIYKFSNLSPPTNFLNILDSDNVTFCLVLDNEPKYQSELFPIKVTGLWSNNFNRTLQIREETVKIKGRWKYNKWFYSNLSLKITN